MVLTEVRCRCGKLLARNLDGRIEIVCHTCKRLNTINTDSLTKHCSGVIMQPREGVAVK
jgi:phage FluMu protein Com